MSFSKQHVQRSSFCDILSKDICWRLTDFVLISFLGKMKMIGYFFYIESFSVGSHILMRCEMDVHCKLYIIGHQKQWPWSVSVIPSTPRYRKFSPFSAIYPREILDASHYQLI